MSAERKAIRKEIKALLSGSTNAGTNVHVARAINQIDDNLPAIHVYAISENSEDTSDAPKYTTRPLNVVVEILTKGVDGEAAVDEGDDIAQQIEDIFDLQHGNVNLSLGCLVERITYQGMTSSTEPGGDATISNLRMSYSVEYVKQANVSNALDEYHRTGVEWEQGTANDPDPEMEDLFEMEHD